MRELSKMTTAETEVKPLGMSTLATGSDERVDAAADSRVPLAHPYHAEGGLTDGCYALYNGTAHNVGLMDDVLAQIKVGRKRGRKGGKEEGGAVIEAMTRFEWHCVCMV